MNWKLVAGLACGMALLLGACSGNPPATSSGTTPPPDENGDRDGDGGLDDTGLTAAQVTLRTAVQDTHDKAEQLVTAAKAAPSIMSIAAARDALNAAVAAAKAYRAASEEFSPEVPDETVGQAAI